MSLRKKNLLEAFRKSDAPSPAPAAAPVAREGAGSSLTPLFDAATTLSSASRASRPNWAAAVIGIVVAFVLGFVAGRNTRPEARAEEGAAPAPVADALRPRPSNQPRAFQERPEPGLGNPVATAPEARPPSSGDARIEESALFEQRNLYTVVVASYGKAHEDLAWATHQHLLDAKIPVFPPVSSRNLLLVLAGAAPTSAELQKVEEAVKALSRDGKKKDYSDAYRARIDPLIPRPKKETSKP